MNIIICDDNKDESKICAKLLMRYAEVKGTALNISIYSSGNELLFKIEGKQNQVDLIYLDVSMPDIDGFETAQKLRNMGYSGDIVFYTQRKEHALRGYDFGALHYIVKKETKAKKFIEILERAIENKNKREKEIMVFSCAGETASIPVDSIKYFDIMSRIVTVHHVDGDFDFYSTMAKLEEQLYGKGFERIHKSYLVNKGFIAKVTSRGVILVTGETLPVSRKYLAAINEKK